MSNKVKIDTDHLPPVLEIRLSTPIRPVTTEISAQKSIKIPPRIEWCRVWYNCMGVILQGKADGDNKSWRSTRVVIEGTTYSYRQDSSNDGSMNPVDPNLCNQNWVIDRDPPATPPSLSPEQIAVNRDCFFYTMEDMGAENHPVSRWVDHGNAEAAEETSDPDYETIRTPLQKKPRRSPAGTSGKHR